MQAIALTIDDGPSPIYAPQVLQILEKYHVTASFSMIGENVTYYPEMAREVAGAGHAIVNHTWNHADLALLSASQTRAEIASATDAIHAAVGETPRMFRAPYGAWSQSALEYCASEHLKPLDWSVDPRDWSMPGVREIVSNIMANTRTGSIIASMTAAATGQRRWPVRDGGRAQDRHPPPARRGLPFDHPKLSPDGAPDNSKKRGAPD
jgi:peptidoglycan-N-acetylglucosamine deacetylase